MLTGVQQETPYCSPGNPSGKQMKSRSTSQPQFSSEKSIESQISQIPHNNNPHRSREFVENRTV